MKQYEILEHTGDAKLRAFGKTKEELFLNAMRGMFAIIAPELKMKSEKVKRKLAVTSADINALLVDFLSEVNYFVQTEREVYEDVVFKKFTDRELEAELIGGKAESFEEEVKAVTYYGLAVEQNEEGLWEATITFDI